MFWTYCRELRCLSCFKLRIISWFQLCLSYREKTVPLCLTGTWAKAQGEGSLSFSWQGQRQTQKSLTISSQEAFEVSFYNVLNNAPLSLQACDINQVNSSLTLSGGDVESVVCGQRSFANCFPGSNFFFTCSTNFEMPHFRSKLYTVQLYSLHHFWRFKQTNDNVAHLQAYLPSVVVKAHPAANCVFPLQVSW